MPAQKEQDLENIKEQILKMGSFVEDAIRKSIKALVERDRDLAVAVIDGDAIVNNFDVEIEELCIRFLALWQPTGSNLRLVTTAIKIITDIERIGDMAVDTCERAVEMLDERRDGFPDGVLDEAPHFEDLFLDVFKVLFFLCGHMVLLII